jgi:hypothetical protein
MRDHRLLQREVGHAALPQAREGIRSTIPHALVESEGGKLEKDTPN